MKLINIGFGSMVAANRLLAIVGVNGEEKNAEETP